MLDYILKSGDAPAADCIIGTLGLFVEALAARQIKGLCKCPDRASGRE